VALRIAGVQPDDEVIVPTVTFIATVNAVSYAQAHPVFVDCDEFYNIDVDGVRQFIAETTFKDGRSVSTRTGRRVAAVLPSTSLATPSGWSSFCRCAANATFA
jgi:dTDP-4-amino-4,6-dideoxygalactose transaminase